MLRTGKLYQTISKFLFIQSMIIANVIEKVFYTGHAEVVLTFCTDLSGGKLDSQLFLLQCTLF